MAYLLLFFQGTVALVGVLIDADWHSGEIAWTKLKRLTIGRNLDRMNCAIEWMNCAGLCQLRSRSGMRTSTVVPSGTCRYS